MDSFTPLRSKTLGWARAKSGPSNTVPLSAFGRDGDRHVTGTITRKEAQPSIWLTETPHRYFVAFGLLFAPNLYRGITEGSSPVAVVTTMLVLLTLTVAVVVLARLREEKRIASTESNSDATHLASGFLMGSGQLDSERRSADQIGIYATNHGIMAVRESRRQSSEFEVHRLDLTATREGKVTAVSFMVGSEQYALRASRGHIAPAH